MTVLIVVLMFIAFVVADVARPHGRQPPRRAPRRGASARRRSPCRCGSTFVARGAEPQARRGAAPRARILAVDDEPVILDCVSQDPRPRRLQRRHGRERTGGARAGAAERLRSGVHRPQDAGHGRRRGGEGRQAPAPRCRRRRDHRLRDDRVGRGDDARRRRRLRPEALHRRGADRLRQAPAHQARGSPRGAAAAARARRHAGVRRRAYPQTSSACRGARSFPTATPGRASRMPATCGSASTISPARRSARSRASSSPPPAPCFVAASRSSRCAGAAPRSLSRRRSPGR